LYSNRVGSSNSRGDYEKKKKNGGVQEFSHTNKSYLPPQGSSCYYTVWSWTNKENHDGGLQGIWKNCGAKKPKPDWSGKVIIKGEQSQPWTLTFKKSVGKRDSITKRDILNYVIGAGCKTPKGMKKNTKREGGRKTRHTITGG